jgi:hypothetical protein
MITKKNDKNISKKMTMTLILYFIYGVIISLLEQNTYGIILI